MMTYSKSTKRSADGVQMSPDFTEPLDTKKPPEGGFSASFTGCLRTL